MTETKRHWHDERSPSDAPVWLSYEEASAWASGWNAAIQACVEEQDETLAVELGDSHYIDRQCNETRPHAEHWHTWNDKSAYCTGKETKGD